MCSSEILTYRFGGGICSFVRFVVLFLSSLVGLSIRGMMAL